MPAPQQLTVQAKTNRLKILLGRMAPRGGGLEAVSAGLESVLEGAGDIEPAVSAVRNLDSLHAGESLSPDELGQLEAIVLPRFRPALLISQGRFPTPPAPWTHLGDDPIRQRLETAFRSIGRVELPNSPTPYAGTAFVVGPQLMMTNRHVAEAFAIGLGERSLVFRPGRTSAIDFGRELGQGRGTLLVVRKVVMIHPYWDMALLEVEGLEEQHPRLTLHSGAFDDLASRETEIAVVGYPAFDPRNPDTALQNQIFEGQYEVKRLQPGKLQPRLDFTSYKRLVRAGVHDASTLGGNSGSAVIDIQTGHVVALHFAGEYLKANYAVPASELAQDSRVVQAGVQFTPGAGPSEFYGKVWTDLENRESLVPSQSRGAGSSSAASRFPNSHSPATGSQGFGGQGFGGPGLGGPVSASGGSGGGGRTDMNGGVSVSLGGGPGSITFQIPLQITLSFGTPQVATHPAGAPGGMVMGPVTSAGPETGPGAGAAATARFPTPGTAVTGGVPAPGGAPGAEGLFDRLRPRPQDPLSGFVLPALGDRGEFWQRAKSLALASRVAYWEPTLRTSQGQPSLGTTLSAWGFEGSEFLSRGATQCFVAWTGDTVLVAFRGTTDLSDWLSNLKILDIDRSYGPVHRGFHGQFQDVADELGRRLDTLPHTRLFVTGHSLGGAIATVAAAEWATRPVPPTGIFTFGQPATGHGRLVSFLTDSYPDRFHRFVNHRDIVPRVPPGYQHVGTLWKFDGAGQLAADPRESAGAVASLAEEDETFPLSDFEALQRLLRGGTTLQDVLGGGAAGGPHTESLLPWIDDHAIEEYLKKIERQLAGRFA